MASDAALPGPTLPETEATRQARRDARRQIARLLHDSVSQSLTGTYLQAVIVTQKLQKDGVAQTEGLARLAEMLRQTVLELRGITQQLTAEEGTPPPEAESR